MPSPYDAVLLVSFGGPEAQEDVLPFLENVLRGRNVPRERLLEVAEHYYHFGGISPINAQCRELLAALRKELDAHGIDLPLYWGNRNWHPLLPDAVAQMQRDGFRRALAFFTSAFSSYSGCRQYRENVEAARQQVAARGLAPPEIDNLRAFFNHPGFIGPMVESVSAALAKVPAELRATTPVLFTAHSIPQAMADNCRYVAQFQEASRLVAAGANVSHWRLVYQSRSGPPSQPWLGPDVGDAIAEIAAAKSSPYVIVVPIGFISDHMEVLFDLDYEARHKAEELGLQLIRAATVGTHPQFVSMIRELIEERLTDRPERLTLGELGPNHDVCPLDCCKYEPQRTP